ncbi:PAS domain-containing protein [Parageobacillus toebii]|uniref:Sensor histidine kinase regulating citrate/malate metabolism n=1 Tax=Parageobacillus toebii NBRC 107807 TaxID=1223503 RepID=A0AA89NMC8_9BACL|nr:PAS domain-containing protein [Parageobacillus toebii]MBB3870470.1 sensor histidine kinase regulating citrate/malate metabolism [Parageobacillus toebii NBRC 107807]
MKQTIIDPHIWESIFSSIHNGVIVVDRNMKILLINSSAKKLLQIENENWEGKDIRELIPTTQLPHVLESGTSSIGVKMNIAGRQCLVNRTPFVPGWRISWSNQRSPRYIRNGTLSFSF